MSFTTNHQTVFGDKRVVLGTASGSINNTPLEKIDNVMLTPVSDGTASGIYTVSISSSGTFTITGPANVSYSAMVIGV